MGLKKMKKKARKKSKHAGKAAKKSTHVATKTTHDATKTATKATTKTTTKATKTVEKTTVSTAKTVEKGTVAAAKTVEKTAEEVAAEVKEATDEAIKMIKEIISAIKKAGDTIAKLSKKVDVSIDVKAVIDDINHGVMSVINEITQKVNKSKNLLVLIFLAFFSPLFPLYIQYKFQQYLLDFYRPKIMRIVKTIYLLGAFAFFLVLANDLNLIIRIIFGRNVKYSVIVYLSTLIMYLVFIFIITPYTIQYVYKFYLKILSKLDYKKLLNLAINTFTKESSKFVKLIENKIGNLNIKWNFLKL